VTLADADVRLPCPSAQRDHGHCLVDMGTGFDDFTARAHAFATAGLSAQQQANRGVLRAGVNTGGLTVYSGEWWHFDGPGAFEHLPILAAPVN
jgi:D-alanyl-D-alanine dipeptidase